MVSVDADPEEEGTHGYIVSQAAQRYITALREAGHQAETLAISKQGGLPGRRGQRRCSKEEGVVRGRSVQS